MSKKDKLILVISLIVLGVALLAMGAMNKSHEKSIKKDAMATDEWVMCEEDAEKYGEKWG